MNRLYSILIVIVALFVFASLAVAKPPFWDDQINSPARFKVLSEFGNAAVFDKETGLVWEQSPGDTDGDGDVENNDMKTWLDAHSHCNNKAVGGRKGWRLPTVQEFTSLVDPTQGSPALPIGHPFSNNVQGNTYWTATADASGTTDAWTVNFGNGNTVRDSTATGGSRFVWCVRGGQGVDAQ